MRVLAILFVVAGAVMVFVGVIVAFDSPSSAPLGGVALSCGGAGVLVAGALLLVGTPARTVGPKRERRGGFLDRLIGWDPARDDPREGANAPAGPPASDASREDS